MSIKAARLDAQGRYLGMEDLPDAGALTERHLATITECDLPADGSYQWVPEDDNPYGGAFWPVKHLQLLAEK